MSNITQGRFLLCLVMFRKVQAKVDQQYSI